MICRYFLIIVEVVISGFVELEVTEGASSVHKFPHEFIDYSIFYSFKPTRDTNESNHTIKSGLDAVAHMGLFSSVLSTSPLAFSEMPKSEDSTALKAFWIRSERTIKDSKLVIFVIHNSHDLINILEGLKGQRRHNGTVKTIYCVIFTPPHVKNLTKVIYHNKSPNTAHINNDIYYGNLFWKTPAIPNKFPERNFTIRFREHYRVNEKVFTRNVHSINASSSHFISQFVEIYINLLPKAKRRSNLKGASIVTTVPSLNEESLREKIHPPWMKPVNEDLELIMNFTQNFKSTQSNLVYNSFEKAPQDAEFTAFAQTINQHKIKMGGNMALPIPIVSQKLYAFYLHEHLDPGLRLHEDKFKGMLWTSFALTWSSILGSLVVIKKVFAAGKISTSLKDRYFLRENFMWAVAFISLRTWNRTPTKAPIRIVFFFAGIFSLLFYVTYSSLIISSITTHKPKIQSFEDIIRMKYDLTTYYGSLPLVSLWNNTLQKEKIRGYTVTGKEQIQHILKSANPVAHITYIDSFIKAAGRQGFSKEFICSNFDQVVAARTSGGMIVRKDSEFREILNYQILKIMEKGFIKRYLKYDETLAWMDLCSSSQEFRHFHKSHFDDFLPCIFVIMGGFLLGTALMVIEQLYHKTCACLQSEARKVANLPEHKSECQIKIDITARARIRICQ